MLYFLQLELDLRLNQEKFEFRIFYFAITDFLVLKIIGTISVAFYTYIFLAVEERMQHN